MKNIYIKHRVYEDDNLKITHTPKVCHKTAFVIGKIVSLRSLLKSVAISMLTNSKPLERSGKAAYSLKYKSDTDDDRLYTFSRRSISSTG